MKKSIAKTTVLLAAVGAALAALPAVGQPTAPCLTGGQIGTCPGWVDMNGNGKWDAGVDQLITFSFSVGTNQLTINNPWSTHCGDATGNVIAFGSPTGCGYTTAFKFHPVIGPQQILATGFTGGLPNAFSLYEGGLPQGTGSLVPAGGPYSGIQLSGGMNYLVGFQGVDASGGGGTYNHITIPWALSSALGMNGVCKIASPDPQPFLPVVPGVAPGTFQLKPSFPGMCSSPDLLLAPWTFDNGSPIPTLTECGMIVLMLGMAVFGWRMLRQGQLLA